MQIENPIKFTALVENPDADATQLKTNQAVIASATAPTSNALPNDAKFVTQPVPQPEVPNRMVAGQQYQVSVTMKNTGSNTWTTSNGYRLGSQCPQDDQNWGLSGAQLLSEVKPDTEVTFNFKVTAPSKLGNYTFQWQMLQQKQGQVGWFGELTPGVPVRVMTNNAAFVRQSVPTSMVPGQQYEVSVTMKNTGTSTWTSTDSNPYFLGLQNPEDNIIWALSRVGLPPEVNEVKPGSEVTFNFTVTAPSTPGSYKFQWQMLQELQGKVAWFGELTQNQPVDVAPTNDAEFIHQSVPNSMVAGQKYNVSVTMKNIDISTWTSTGNNPFRLGAQKPQDNQIWGLSRVNLPSDVAPGAQVTFNFTVTAPSVPDTYNFQWQMLQELQPMVQCFGDLTENVAVVVSAPALTNNSAFVSHSASTSEDKNPTFIGVPTSMVAAQKYNVSVTMKNTGTSTWTSSGSHPHRLGAQNPQDNQTWGLSRFDLPYDVAPGAEVTFNFTVTAPSVPDTYNFQWQMRQEMVEWFGDSTPNMSVIVSAPALTNEAAFVSQSVPTCMLPGQKYNVSVTMKNTGTSTWTASGSNPHRLGSQNPQDNQTWGLSCVDLPYDVAPGAEVTFNFTVTAPSVPGTYNFQWQMRQDMVEWFGDSTPNLSVSVLTCMVAGQSYNVSVTMKNTGTSTWTASGSNPHRLGSQNPQDNQIWGLSRVDLPYEVAPGAEVRFNFTVTAPSVPGTYNFQWRMLQEMQVMVEWFGDLTPNVVVNVTAPDPTTNNAMFISQSMPISLEKEKTQISQVLGRLGLFIRKKA